MPTLDALGIAAAHLDDRVGHELVVDDDVGFLQQPLRAQRQQILGPRPCPDQPDDARRLGGMRLEQRLGIRRRSPVTRSS